ncbi:ABC transporter permease [Duganella sp. FT80W]|uniref:Autoinducer 2 import system permease protein LsrC n=1 Tax=Duganella guangzhouensis TaxID=2666084 RepID=A0A6I2L2E9_9BURK|nr:ABC transporter permease [Duganella guangzhouensis]MRW92073.1 ABC transporter permease [Duganella guangzhouensis]
MRFLTQREPQLALVIVLLVLLIGWRAPVFLSVDSFTNVLTDSSLLIMLALTQMLVIVTRGIDLSVASSLALSGMLSAMLVAAYPGTPLLLVVLLAAVTGLLCGLVNGALIGLLNLPPIVVTLGTMSIYRGLVFVVSGGAWVSSHQLPKDFLAFPLETMAGMTNLFWIATGAVLLFWGLTRYARFGRDLYAIGNQPASARYVGVPIKQRLVLVYALSGLVSGLAGYLWVARYAVAYTEVAYGFEFTVIAACVIGGVSIGGGVGSVAGTVLGALFLGVIGNALPVLKVSPFWQSALTGAVILAAVVINARGKGHGARQILPVNLSKGGAA